MSFSVVLRGHFALLGLLISISLSACRVRGVDQRSEMDLGDYTAPNAAELGPGEPKRADLVIGVDESGRVPLELEWEVAKDAGGCLRIKRAALRRVGGPTGFEVYNVKFKLRNQGECATRLDLGSEKFEDVDVSYCWRWNGASNTSDCAYDGAVTLSADRVGAQGFDVKRAPSASASAPR